MDSISYLTAEDAGRVVVSGSHGGLSSADYARSQPLAGVFFNDAGVGKDAAGIAALAALAALGMPAAAYSHLSARIGDAQDAWDHGTVVHTNAVARRCGIRAGMAVAKAARLCDEVEP
jgi:hypothetical protein